MVIEMIVTAERVVFSEETAPKEHLRLIASGDLNEPLLGALEDFVRRQRKRLARTADVDAAIDAQGVYECGESEVEALKT